MTERRADAQRIDLLLWHVRLAKTRSVARQLAERGIVRVNGRRVEKAHHLVRVGDVLTVPWQDGVVVRRIVALPPRRLPAARVPECLAPLDADPALRA